MPIHIREVMHVSKGSPNREPIRQLPDTRTGSKCVAVDFYKYQTWGSSDSNGNRPELKPISYSAYFYGRAAERALEQLAPNQPVLVSGEQRFWLREHEGKTYPNFELYNANFESLPGTGGGSSTATDEDLSGPWENDETAQDSTSTTSTAAPPKTAADKPSKGAKRVTFGTKTIAKSPAAKKTAAQPAGLGSGNLPLSHPADA